MMTLPELPLHPEPWAYRWTEEELRTIREYGEACAKAEREACAKVCEEVHKQRAHAGLPSRYNTIMDCAEGIRARVFDA